MALEEEGQGEVEVEVACGNERRSDLLTSFVKRR